MKLHKKIIESIVQIQRWFRGILQRRKFVLFRSAAITLQSFWRMCAAQKQFLVLRQERAAVVIQSAWRMTVVRRWYQKLRAGAIVLQARVRGQLARARFKRSYKQKLMRDRSKLKQTQSLPMNERSIDCPPELQHQDYYSPVHRKAVSKPHTTSLDAESTQNLRRRERDMYKSTESIHRYSPPLITPQLVTGYVGPSQGHRRQQNNNNEYDQQQQRKAEDYHDYQNLQKVALDQHVEDTVDKIAKGYDLVKASKIYNDTYDISSPSHSSSVQHPANKVPVRRVESVSTGPVIRRDVYYEQSRSSGSAAPLSSSRSVSNMPVSDVEVVLVNSGMPDNATSATKLSSTRRSGELSSRSSMGEEMHKQHSQQNTSPYNHGGGVTYTGGIGTNLASTQVSMAPGSPYNRGGGGGGKYADEASSSPGPALYSTPKGKAAALLGTISEDKQKKGASAAVTPEYHKVSRRVKSNFSDELPDTTSHSHQHNINSLLSRRSHVLSSSDSLKRRNSDPSTNKISLLDVNRGNDMYQSSTHINIAGHRFRKADRIGKADKCASCQESDAFVNEGHRCVDCKVLVHTKCIQNGGVKTLQCEAKRSKRRKNQWNEKIFTPNSKYSGTREYTDSTDKIISDAKELQLMQDFITQKICKMESDCGKPSEVDRVFKQALREFKDNLVAQFSIANKQSTEVLNIKYRDLIANFEQVMETCCGDKRDDFPLTMGVNAFRGFMNEFMNSRETEKPKAKRKKDKKRKVDDHTSYNGGWLIN